MLPFIPWSPWKVNLLFQSLLVFLFSPPVYISSLSLNSFCIFPSELLRATTIFNLNLKSVISRHGKVMDYLRFVLMVKYLCHKIKKIN